MNWKSRRFTLTESMIVVAINRILVTMPIARFAAYAKQAGNKAAPTDYTRPSTHVMASSG